MWEDGTFVNDESNSGVGIYESIIEMLVTVYIKKGVRKTITLPYEALDDVKKMVYNNRDKIAGYAICISDYERVKDVKLLEECN